MLIFLLKVTDTLTAILGAKKNGKKIATYDWTTMTYQELPMRFTNDRYQCSCGLLRKPNGQPLAAVAGKNVLGVLALLIQTKIYFPSIL